MSGKDSEIIIDTREQKWEKMFQYLDELDAPPYRLDTLHHKADFIIRNHHELAIQRKQIDDFVGSIGDLKEDLQELRANYEMGALLIEGDWQLMGGSIAQRRGNTVHQTITAEQLHNFLLSQQLRGTLFLKTSGLKETCRILVNSHGYLDGPISGDKTPESPAVLLGSFPGIGPATTGAIISHFGDAHTALQNIDRWQEVKGVGPKTQEQVEEWLQ